MVDQTIKPYLVHPKEWKLGVCLLLLLGGAYLHVRTAVPDGTTQDSGWIQLAKSTADVRDMAYNYCSADLSLMCAYPSQTRSWNTFCALAFADTPLWRPLGLASRPSDSQNCGLERLSKTGGAPSLLFTQDEKTKFKDDETQVILSLMGKSLSFMWIAAQNYFSADLRVGTSIRSSSSLEEQDRMVRWLLANFVDFFASDGAGRQSKAMRRGITARAWTREELKELYQWSVQYKHSHQDGKSSADTIEAFHKKFLSRVSEAIEELETLRLPSFLAEKTSKQLEIRKHVDIKQAYHIFDEMPHEVCLYPHFAAGSLITNNCAQAMTAAPAKLRELELEEGADFGLLTRTYAFCANLFYFLMLIVFYSQRQRMETRMEKGRRRLEQELNDPFLRQVLEKKAAALPEDQRAGFTSRLESKAATWDTQGAALKLARRNVRTLRFIVLFHLLLTTLVALFLCTFHVAHLENAMLSILVLTASYAVPLADPKADRASAVVSSEQELTIPATQALLFRV